MTYKYMRINSYIQNIICIIAHSFTIVKQFGKIYLWKIMGELMGVKNGGTFVRTKAYPLQLAHIFSLGKTGIYRSRADEMPKEVRFCFMLRWKMV